MTHAELIQQLADLAIEADESGLDVCASGVMLLVKASRLPHSVKRWLVNTGHMIVDGVCDPLVSAEEDAEAEMTMVRAA